MTQATAVRVLIVDDQHIIREGISTILSFQDGLDVVGTAANGHEAVEKAEALRPDVILMDVRMPGMDGVAATAQICQKVPGCKILMLTTFDDEQYVIQALKAGASGYLLKDIPGPELAQAVRSVQAGIYQLDPSVASRMVANMTGGTPAPQAAPTPATVAQKNDLTEREMGILRLIATGATNREIAEKLFITEGTVKNHISNIFVRMGLRDRTQAALYAREKGLL